MATLIPAIQLTGTADAEDRRWMQHIIKNENNRRTIANAEITQQNTQRAQQTPPLAPLPLIALLPFSTAAERKTSAESVMNTRNTEIIAKYLKSANDAAAEVATADASFRDYRTAYSEATAAKKQASLAAAIAALA